MPGRAPPDRGRGAGPRRPERGDRHLPRDPAPPAAAQRPRTTSGTGSASSSSGRAGSSRPRITSGSSGTRARDEAVAQRATLPPRAGGAPRERHRGRAPRGRGAPSRGHPPRAPGGRAPPGRGERHARGRSEPRRHRAADGAPRLPGLAARGADAARPRVGASSGTGTRRARSASGATSRPRAISRRGRWRSWPSPTSPSGRGAKPRRSRRSAASTAPPPGLRNADAVMLNRGILALRTGAPRRRGPGAGAARAADRGPADAGRSPAGRSAKAHYELGHYDQAERQFRLAAAAAPQEPSSWLGAGLAALAQNRLAEAEDALQRARFAAVDVATSAWYGLVLVSVQQGDRDAFRERGTNFVDRFPRHPAAPAILYGLIGGRAGPERRGRGAGLDPAAPPGLRGQRLRHRRAAPAHPGRGRDHAPTSRARPIATSWPGPRRRTSGATRGSGWPRRRSPRATAARRSGRPRASSRTRPPAIPAPRGRSSSWSRRFRRRASRTGRSAAMDAFLRQYPEGRGDARRSS